jgi:sugar phosphate isomerase/epimerase
MDIGYQAVYDEDYSDALDYAAQHGFQYVQFDLNVPRFYVDNLDETNLRKIRETAEKNKVAISFHAPGDNISLFSDYPLIRQGIINHFSKIFEKANLLGARHVTIHTGHYPSFNTSGSGNDDFEKKYAHYFADILYQNLYRLADVSGETLLCVENFKLTNVTMTVLEKVFAEGLPIYLTWDLAKTYDLQLNCNEKVEEFMRKHEDRIREVHIHDIKKGFRSHQTLGTGNLDLERYRSILSKPDIAITIEVRPREEAFISKKMVESLF